MNTSNDKNVSKKEGSELIKSLKKTILLVFALASGIFCRDANSSLAGCLNCLHIASRSITAIDRTATRINNVLSGKNVNEEFNGLRAQLGKDLLEHFNIDLGALNIDNKSVWHVEDMDCDSITDIIEMRANHVVTKCFDMLESQAANLGQKAANYKRVDADSLNQSLGYLASIIAQIAILNDRHKTPSRLVKNSRLLEGVAFSTLEHVMKPILSAMKNLAIEEDYTSQIRTLHALIDEIEYNNEAAMNMWGVNLVKDGAQLPKEARAFRDLSFNVQERASELISILRGLRYAQMNKMTAPMADADRLMAESAKTDNQKSSSVLNPEETTVAESSIFTN